MPLASASDESCPKIRFSAVLIVKNEAAFLDGCLRSLVGITDEIVVVDTGSEDDTISIAHEYGAKVLHYPWDGDFAAARNFGLDHALGEWILYIDADERIVSMDAAIFEACLDAKDVAAYSIWFSVRVNHTPYRELRIWRSHPDIRFQGCIHESIRPAIAEYCAKSGLKHGFCDLEMQHLGYEGDLTAKHHRNLPLLLRRQEQAPDIVFNWCHLGQVYSGLGQDDLALQALKHGVEAARASLRPCPPDGLVFVQLAKQKANAKDATDQDRQQALDLIAEGVTRYPGNLLLVWVKACILSLMEKYDQAIPLFDQFAAIDGELFRDPWIGYDRKLFGELAYDSLGLCHFRLGRYDQAVHWYGLAVQAAPDCLEYRMRLRVAEHRLQNLS